MMNYRYPDKCCGKCTHQYISSYGDSQCTKATGQVVDQGAICDEFMLEPGKKPVVVLPTMPLYTDVSVRQCADCTYYGDLGFGAICMYKGKPAVQGGCKDWKKKEVVVIAQDEIEALAKNEEYTQALVRSREVEETTITCTTCKHSYIDGYDGVPHCDVDSKIIEDVTASCKDADL